MGTTIRTLRPIARGTADTQCLVTDLQYFQGKSMDGHGPLLASPVVSAFVGSVNDHVVRVV